MSFEINNWWRIYTYLLLFSIHLYVDWTFDPFRKTECIRAFCSSVSGGELKSASTVYMCEYDPRSRSEILNDCGCMSDLQ